MTAEPSVDLVEGELVLHGRIMPASNATFVGEIDGVRVVYKPVAGERPLWDFPDGTLADRERAAYLVSEAIGWNVVPETWLRDGPHGRGMVQRWQEPDGEQVAVTLVAEGEVPDGLAARLRRASTRRTSPVSLIHEDSAPLRRMAVFDIVVNNADRKGGHVLAMTDGHRYGVDHGVTFHTDHKLRTVLWGWLGEPLTRRRGRGRPRGRAPRSAARSGDALAEHLTDLEIEALARRCDRLAERGADAGAARRVARDPVAAVLSTHRRLGFATMRAWPSPEIPTLSRHRARRSCSTTPPPAAPSRPRRRAPPGCTSAASRRTTPPTSATPRPTSRSTCSTAPGATPATTSPTSRTSPTSTTRCSSGPRRCTSTGSSSPSARPSCSARTWPRCGCSRRTHYIGAVESIPLVIELIQRLEAAGSVYKVEDDLYFSVTADPAFGAESGWSREQMLEIYPERGGDPDRAGKKDPLDCVVWRGRREGEPSWDSPWGPGRPGWHIECTAIAHGAPRRRLRRPGRRQRPGLPAPRDVRRPRPGRRPRYAVRAGLQPRRHGRLRRREDVEVARQPGLRLGAAQQRRRPDGDPAGAAAPPLPLRLGVDRRRALGRRRRRRPLAPGALAGRRRARRRRSSPRSSPRSPTTSTPRAPSPRSTPGSPPPSAPTASPTPATPTPPVTMLAVLDAALGLAIWMR